MKKYLTLFLLFVTGFILGNSEKATHVAEADVPAPVGDGGSGGSGGGSDGSGSGGGDGG